MDFQQLAQGRIPRAYAPGQMIYLQDTVPTAFYYLVEGTVKSFISSPEGGERLLTLHHGGDLMGEASFFDGFPRVSSAVAVTSCKVVSIDSKQLDECLRRYPQLALPMLRYLAGTIRILSGHVDALTFRPAPARLAAVLLERRDGRGEVRATHEELGSAIGASRVTVSRVLSQFAKKGWVETGYGKLTVADERALTEYARRGDL